MTVIVLQHQKAVGAFETRSRQRLTATDERRAKALADSTAAAELGYFDILLIVGRVDAPTFSAAALPSASIVRGWYDGARDAIIGIK